METGENGLCSLEATRSSFNAGGIAEFAHLIVEESLWEELHKKEGALEALCERQGADFVSVRKRGLIRFLHCTGLENKESVEARGLEALKGAGRLGEGVYAMEAGSDKLRNLESFADANIGFPCLLVEGEYEGEYAECVFDRITSTRSHEGFLALKANSIPARSLRTKEIRTLFD